MSKLTTTILCMIMATLLRIAFIPFAVGLYVLGTVSESANALLASAILGLEMLKKPTDFEL